MVKVEGILYVGGGRTPYTVMEHDSSSGKWSKLPPYRVGGFVMTVINSQLVLVGGHQRSGTVLVKMVSVWSAERREWTHPYPDMSTGRYVFCSWL